jgi:hypothetical protein
MFLNKNDTRGRGKIYRFNFLNKTIGNSKDKKKLRTISQCRSHVDADVILCQAHAVVGGGKSS